MRHINCILALFCASVALTSLRPGNLLAQDHTVFVDADASARIICRNDQDFATCELPRGDTGFVRVHDQNALMSGYFHFDLGDLDASSNVTEARFQLDSQTNSWGDTTVSVFAAVDSSQDWDLDQLPEDEINGINAPFSDYDSFAWTGDDVADGQQRFNAPTPFLDEGTQASSPVRVLEEFIFNDNQDPITSVDGNSYGGSDNGLGDGAGGSADGGTNIWPVKNAVDIDVTDLVNWKLGKDPGYSDFAPNDRDLTIMVRTAFPEFGGDNGFIRYIAKESQFLGGELDLQPGRIVLSGNIVVGPGVGDPLQPGDANQDYSFDQLDIVQVSVAAKYLSGQPATWGEGDWNGGPGGFQGSPPAGNGLFDQLDIIAALSAGKYLTGPYAALVDGGDENDEQTSLIYDPGTGELSVDAPTSTDLTSIFVTSAGNRFIGDQPAVLDGPFDSFAPDNIFKSTIGSSFGDISFGNVLPGGLAKETVLGDLSASGSLDGGGGLGEVDLIYIPEPTTFALIGLGFVCLFSYRRRR